MTYSLRRTLYKPLLGYAMMQIGVALGSKATAEIALAVMADIMRVQHGQTINEL